MDRGDGRREDLVRRHLILVSRETGFKSVFPRYTQFRIDVNDVDPGVDRAFQIVVRRAGTAMQSKGYTGGEPDLSNSPESQDAFAPGR